MNIENQTTNTAGMNLENGFKFTQSHLENQNGQSFQDEFLALMLQGAHDTNGADGIRTRKIKMSDFDFKSVETELNYDTLKMDKNDVAFFVNTLNEANIINVNKEGFTVNETRKTMEVSKTLFNLLEKARNTQKPLRIDFDNNMTVVLRVDGKGKLSADFFPGNQAVEEYLRNNIPYLKQRFEEQNISYNSLNYHQSKNNNKKKNKGES